MELDLLLFLLFFLKGTDGHSSATFFEEPRTSYILTGNTATFYCKASSHEAHWIINNDLVNPFFLHLHPEFQFRELLGDHSHNLTLITTGSNETNLTTIGCKAYGGPEAEPAYSQTAMLYVFDTFVPPPQPIITTNFINGEVLVELSAPYLWADFETSFYNITLVRLNDDDLSSLESPVSHPIIISSVNSAYVSIELNTTRIPSLQYCSKYELNVVLISDVFGVSTPSILGFVSPREEMPTLGKLDVLVHFNTTGAPFFTVYTELNRICPLLNYTYTMHLRGSENTEPMRIGPKRMTSTNSGMINEVLVGGLEANKYYTVQVEVTFPFYTVQTSIFSEIQTFETTINQKFFSEPSTSDSLDSREDNISDTEYVTATLGVLCAILAVVLLVIVATVCICYLKQKRKPMASQSISKQSSDPMVTNPIYNGPVYETVHQGYSPLSSSGSTTPDSVSSPTTPLNAESSRYNTNPTSRTDILDLVRRSTLPTQPNGRVVSPLAGTSYRSSSISGNATVKHPPRERNKLHLTLSLGNERVPNNPEVGTSTQEKGGSGKVQWGKEDENYTIMSPAANRGFGSSINGGWGEVSPEPSSKSQE